MTVRLTIDEAAWRSHVQSTIARARHGASTVTGVVKGNGYGFGRVPLAIDAAHQLRRLAVGTVHELDVVAPLAAAAAAGSIPRPEAIVVLTPALEMPSDLPAEAVPTIGHPEHVRALTAIGWRGRVQVKLRSAMQRYGAEHDDVSALIDLARAGGLEAVGYVFHPPVPTTTGESVAAQVAAWLPVLDRSLTISVSHISPEALEQLAVDHPDHRFDLRLGTALWHGDKSALQLSADVVDVHPVAPGSSVGYHGVRVVDGGTVAMIGGGSSHGIAPLTDGRSPFHHRRRRLALVEPPHMHTSMVLVDREQEPPAIGDWVDVQRPLITTWVDQVVRR